MGPRLPLKTRVVRLASRAPVLDGVGILLVTVTLRKGGFHRPDSIVLPAAVLGLALFMAATRRDLGPKLPLGLLGGCTVGFLVVTWASARQHGASPHWTTFAGCVVTFVAAFLIGLWLVDVERAALAVGAGILGALVALSGLVGLGTHAYPLALPAQGHYRLAGTLTYSNATGAMLAVLLVIAMNQSATAVRDAEIFVMTAALIATQSRAAVGALALVLLLGPRGMQGVSRPLVIGVAVGAVGVLGSAESRSGQPELLGAVILGLIAVLRRRMTARVPGNDPWYVRAGLLAIPIAAVLPFHSQAVDLLRARLDGASIRDRQLEWQSAWDAFTQDPVLGAGPGARLRLADGRVADFAHNELLQVLHDVGLLGTAVFLAVVSTVLAMARRTARTSGGGAALVVLAIIGLADFAWHVPAIALTAGLAAAGLPIIHSPGAQVGVYHPDRDP